MNDEAAVIEQPEGRPGASPTARPGCGVSAAGSIARVRWWSGP